MSLKRRQLINYKDDFRYFEISNEFHSRLNFLVWTGLSHVFEQIISLNCSKDPTTTFQNEIQPELASLFDEMTSINNEDVTQFNKNLQTIPEEISNQTNNLQTSHLAQELTTIFFTRLEQLKRQEDQNKVRFNFREKNHLANIESYRFFRATLEHSNSFYKSIIGKRSLGVREFREYFLAQMQMIERFDMPFPNKGNHEMQQEHFEILINDWLEDQTAIFTGIEMEELVFCLKQNLHFDNEYVLLKERVQHIIDKIIENRFMVEVNYEQPVYQKQGRFTKQVNAGFHHSNRF